MISFDPGLRGKNRYRLFPTLKVKAALLHRVYMVCKQHGILVLRVEEEGMETAFYNRLPEIRKISKWTGTIQLLKSFYCSYSSVLIQEDCEGSPAMLLEPLSNIVKNTECYQLTPGRLDKMVEEVSNITK